MKLSCKPRTEFFPLMQSFANNRHCKHTEEKVLPYRWGTDETVVSSVFSSTLARWFIQGWYQCFKTFHLKCSNTTQHARHSKGGWQCEVTWKSVAFSWSIACGRSEYVVAWLWQHLYFIILIRLNPTHFQFLHNHVPNIAECLSSSILLHSSYADPLFVSIPIFALIL